MLLIKNVELYTPEYAHNQDVLIVNDKIAAIGNIDNALPFDDVSVIDGKGCRCIPGLIDQHVHITGGGGESGFASRVPELKLSDCIKAGVTTVVGLLGTDSQTRSVENLVAKTKALNEEGITAYCLTGAYDYPSPTISGDVYKDILYISEVLGVKLAISDHRGPHLTKESLIRLVSQVRVASLISKKAGIVHLHTGSEPQGLQMVLDILNETELPIAHFRPTHIRNHTPGAREFAARGGYLDFTSGRDPKEAATTLAGYLTETSLSQITLSSDANGSQPVWNEKKEIIGITAAKMDTLYQTIMALTVEQGLSFADALSVATSNVAHALKLYPQKGAIAVGSDGDVVILDEHNQIDTVIAKGQLMMLHKELLVKGLFESF